MVEKRGHVQILSEFIGGLNDANGAASQLILHFNSPKWMAIRDMLNIVRDGYIKQTISGANHVK